MSRLFTARCSSSVFVVLFVTLATASDARATDAYDGVAIITGRSITHHADGKAWDPIGLSPNGELIAWLRESKDEVCFESPFEEGTSVENATLSTRSEGSPFQFVALSNSEDRLVVVFMNGRMEIRSYPDLAIEQIVESINIPPNVRIWDVQISPSGRCVAVATAHDGLRLYRRRKDGRWSEKEAWNYRSRTSDIVWSADSEWLAQTFSAKSYPSLRVARVSEGPFLEVPKNKNRRWT